jgi:redox-sensitive bicupin YhaK (pirin superfamily)
MQIWIMPSAEGLPPRYDQKRFEADEKRGRLRLVASPSGGEGSIEIRQDVRMYASLLEPAQSVALTLAPGRHLWVQVLRGSLDVNGQVLSAGDGLAASDETAFRFTTSGPDPSEFLAFDLA